MPVMNAPRGRKTVLPYSRYSFALMKMSIGHCHYLIRILAIQYRMDELGLRQSNMMEEFGNKTTASQIMNRKRPLTLPIIRLLSSRLGLPIAVLAREYSLAPETQVDERDDERLSARG